MQLNYDFVNLLSQKINPLISYQFKKIYNLTGSCTNIYFKNTYQNTTSLLQATVNYPVLNHVKGKQKSIPDHLKQPSRIDSTGKNFTFFL